MPWVGPVGPSRLLPAAHGSGTVPGQEYREGYYRVLLDWSPDDIRSAVYTSSTGYLLLAADLCTAMFGDDRIPAVLSARVMAVQGAPLTFEAAAAGRLRRRALKAAAAEEDWWDILPEAELEALRGWRRFLGVALGELVWTEPDPADPTGEARIARIRNGRNVPRLKVWDPRHLRFDLDLGKLFVRTRDGTEIEIRPGDGKWIVLTEGGSRPWLKACWRAVAELWLAKKYAREDWARQSERYADGFFSITSPDGASEEERDALANDVQNAGKRPVIVWPHGYDAKVIELSARAWETYQTQWEMANRAIAVRILYSDLATESKKSAGTGAQLQGDVRDDVKKADAASDETDLRAQVLCPWALANFGDANLAPWPHYDVDPPEDVTALAASWASVAASLKSANDAGYEVDWQAVREDTGFPVIGRKAPASAGAPPPPAPAQPDVAEQVQSFAALGARGAVEVVARALGAPLTASEARELGRMSVGDAALTLASLFADRAEELHRARRRAVAVRSAAERRHAPLERTST